MASPHLIGHLSGITGILSRLCGISDNFMAPPHLTDHFSGTTNSLYRLCGILDKFMVSPHQMDYLFGTTDILWHCIISQREMSLTGTSYSSIKTGIL